MAIILAAAVSLPALYVADGYVASDYSDDIRAQVSSTAIPSTLVRDQDTIGIFPVSTTLSGAGLTQAAGAQTDVEGNALFAPTYVTSTGMASSGSATMLMPFGMSKDAAAVPIALYMDADYVAPDYVETIRSVLSYVDVGVTKISEPLILPVASSATDIAVTQVHTFGAASEAVATHITAGSRIESTGMLSSATSTTLIPTTRVASTGYKSDATSATDIGSASIKSAGAQSRSGIGTTRVSDLILKAAVNAEPERTLLNTTVTIVISGVETNVKVGDITRNGTVSAFDSAKYAEYLAGSLTDADMLDHIENVLHPWLTANAPDLLLESYSLIAGSFTAGFGAQIESQSTTPTAGEITASFGVKVEGDATTIIASRLKWEPVEEPTDIWTTINDDSYPFG